MHLTYVFVVQDLQEHRRQGRNGEYEEFAIELLALLQRGRHLYTTKAEEPADEG